MTKLFASSPPEGSRADMGARQEDAKAENGGQNACQSIRAHEHEHTATSPSRSPQSDGRGARELPRDLVGVSQMIDLTDKPIRLGREEIENSRVRSNASNCICCCSNNSIILVTTNESYVLDHIPLDHIESAQANASLQFLAMANDEKLAVTDLVESKLGSPASKKTGKGFVSTAGGTTSRLLTSDRSVGRDQTQTRFVNLSALGLSMAEVLFWRWIDELTLALVTRDSLFTCRVDQIQINHPATTALARPLNQLLSLTRVCDLDPNLGLMGQVTNVQRDSSTNLYAISGTYSNQDASSSSDTPNNQQSNQNTPHHPPKSDQNNNNNSPAKMPLHKQLAAQGSLRHNFSSVPGRLSQMATSSYHQATSLDLGNNLRLQGSLTIDSLRRKISLSKPKAKSSSAATKVPTTGGLAQIYCKLRDRSQLILVHAVALTSRFELNSHEPNNGRRDTPLGHPEDDNDEGHLTTLVAANRVGNKLKVHFIGMATTEDLTTSGQNTTRSIKLDQSVHHPDDYPTSIVCSNLTPEDARTHLAMIVTKHGHLFVCSITQGNILFDVRVSHDIVCGSILESKSRGLMAICKNGQVLLVRIDESLLKQMLDETNHLWHVPSQYAINSSSLSPPATSFNHSLHTSQSATNINMLEPSDIGLEVIISTKL